MENEDRVLKNTIYASGFLYYLNKSHDSYLYSFMKEFNINGNEYNFLLYLYHSNGSTQVEVADNFKIPKSQVSRSFKKLEEKELIIRRKNEDNKKFKKIFLTQKAIQIINKLSQVEISWSKMIYKEIGLEEEEIRIILTKITINALDFTDTHKGKL